MKNTTHLNTGKILHALETPRGLGGAKTTSLLIKEDEAGKKFFAVETLEDAIVFLDGIFKEKYSHLKGRIREEIEKEFSISKAFISSFVKKENNKN